MRKSKKYKFCLRLVLSVFHEIWMTLEFLVPHRSDKLVTKSETHCNKSQSFIIQTTEQEYIL
mgnify:CR=1 FL=1